MAAEGGGVDSTPALNLTPDEKRVYGQLFRQADTDSVGVVTGETAVKFFEKTKLDQRILGEIWQIADSENRGFLTPAGFSAVLRLIGHAQHGREPSTELASQPGPLPQFDGIQIPILSPPQTTASLQPQGTGGAVRIPPLTPEKVTQYASLFERQSLQPGGLLPGDQAKSIFDKAGLPNEVLGRIWQLADTESRGALVQTEFVIAMHLLTSMKSGALRSLPNILPAPLYEAATKRSPAPRQSPSNTGTLSAIPRQISGSQPMRLGSPLGRAPVTAQSTGVTGSDWLISPTDKVRFDQLYDDLDKGRKGFITGEEAVPFLSQSNLPEDTLAQIWDLADFTSEGRLNRDTFAVAMYLIRQQRTKREQLPQSLPPNLIPPSMRAARQPPAATASPFDAPSVQQTPVSAPPPPARKSALEDLFGLDTPPAGTPAYAQTSQTTGGSNNDPFASGPQAPSSPAKPSPTATQFRPFVPSSSFGRGLTAQPTGDSAGSGNSSANRVPAGDDLLGDNDPEVSKKLTNETTELANLSNQVSSLSKQMQEVQGQRNTTQQEFNQASAQKKNFEQRLAQLRTLYEKEAGDLQNLQEQLKTARSETQKLQGECLSLDTTYRDLHTQHQQVVMSLEADKQENAALKEKIRAVNADIAQIRPQIEKLKSEARQQKGLVAINKKQLSTNEAEREKLQTEAADLAKDNTGMIARQDTGSSIPGSVSSPAASVSSGNNPFFKRTGSTDIMGAFASPNVKSSTDRSFDDIFGPSDGATGSGAQPAASFRPQNTGTSTGSMGSYSTPPAASPTTSRQGTLAAEPPAPPESRQISSSFLPFAAATESLSSSRAVSPPASRNEEAMENLTTPTQAPSSTVPDESVPSAGAAAPETTTKNGPDDGAVEAAKTPDPFASTDKDQAKADFENAFASFTKVHKSPEPSGGDDTKRSAFDTEFPPISELERDDDDSDTASERGGFDDDFTPASPPTKKPEAAGASTSFPVAPSTPATNTTTGPGSEEKQRSDDQAPASQTTGPTVTSPSKADDIFGASPQPAPTQPTQKKDVFDDLDDDFEGLEDAKEGSADDDFQTVSRSGLDDFNAVFDSSPAPSQSRGDANTTLFGRESSYDFGSVSQTSAATAGANSADASQQKPASPPASAHDWDAIFATLDAPTQPAEGTTQAQVLQVQEDRPGPERTMTNESKDDDPILKNLTGMGYSRTDALAALEKYDYNLERAANYLASQS